MQAAGSGGAILRPAPLQARGSWLSILSVQLRLRHQPSSPGSCDGAVTWGERAAVGPQSVIAPLNHVLSLSPCFASCCLQSLGTLSPYSQVMPPGGSVTCCCHRVSLCQGTTGALLNISLPKVGEVGGPVQEGPLGPGESSMQVLPGRVDPGSSFCPMVGSTSNQEQAWGKGMVCRQGGKSLWPDTVAWSQTLGVTACSLSAGGRASGEPLQLQRTHMLPGTSHHRASTLQGFRRLG